MPQSHTYVKSDGRLNWTRASGFIYERFYILCAWNGHPNEKLWPFDFLENFHFSISSVSIYHRPRSYIHVKSYGRLNWTRASVLNFERLDKLCAWIGHPSEMLWPFQLLDNYQFSILRISIYHVPQSYSHIKRYGYLNWTRASVFNFQCLDILCARIGHPSEMLWPFQLLDNYQFSISSVSIYHVPQSYSHVKRYGRLNWTRAFVFNFDRLDILCAWIGHPTEMLWLFEFL